MGYWKKQWFTFTVGCLWLMLSSASDFLVPLYIGLVITAIEEGRFDDIAPLCW